MAASVRENPPTHAQQDYLSASRFDHVTNTALQLSFHKQDEQVKFVKPPYLSVPPSFFLPPHHIFSLSHLSQTHLA
jgi:hypothetical protein